MKNYQIANNPNRICIRSLYGTISRALALKVAEVTAVLTMCVDCGRFARF